MASLLLHVFNGADNPAEFDVDYYDDDGELAAEPLAGVSRVALSLQGVGVVADTASGGTITWTAAGRIAAYLGAAGLTPGAYPARVRVYDPDHPNGQFITYPNTQNRVTVRVHNGDT